MPPMFSESNAQGPLLDYGDYARFARIVRDRYGLHFSEKRRSELERGVQRAFAASMCTDLDEYYRVLQDPDRNAVHFEQLVNALTVCETHFFRNSAQFDALFNHVLPQIIERRRSLQTLRIWSAGCASGEEPYSIAMLLRELLPDVDSWSITILGTDVNTQGLDRARRCLYGDWAFREERAKLWRSRYFRQVGNRYALIPEIKRMVTFQRLNLKEGSYPAYETNTRFMDLILCRNVTIYFPETITRKVVGQFYESLVGGGWLVVGHSEHSLNVYRRFQTRNFPDAILYQRTGQPSEPIRERVGPVVERRPPPPVRVVTPKPVPVDIQPSILPVTLPEEDSEQPHDPVMQVQDLLDYGRSEEARELLLRLLDDGHNDATVHVLLGRACANLALWEEAEQWCRQAIQLDTLALEAYYTLSLVLQHQGELDQAVDSMKKVVYIDRHHILGHFGLANLYHSRGLLPQALKSLDNASRLLEMHGKNDLVPSSDGITVGRLWETVVLQQQQWSAEVSGL